MTTRTSEVRLDVVPMPAPRPRMTKWGSAYYPASYTAHMKELAAALPKCDEPAMEGELVLYIQFVCKPIAKSKFTTPAGDLDNLSKPLMDVLTKEGWYGDDRQIMSLLLNKRFPKPGETPHINFRLVRRLDVE